MKTTKQQQGQKTQRRAKKNAQGVQLSLFDSDLRALTDRELIEELTPHADKVAEDWEWSYSMERLFNQLTPQRRRIAVAAVELYRRREGKGKLTERIRSSVSIHRIMQPYLAHLEVEEFWVLPLSNSCRLIRPVRVSVGGIDQTLADVRTVMRKLLEVGATCFAVAHNHPSGDIRPSREDNRLTEALQEAGVLMNIKLIDHVIIGGDSYYSYMDDGAI